MKIIHSALSTVHGLATRLGASDQNAEIAAQVVVESAFVLVPTIISAALPPAMTAFSRARRAHAATCWGGMTQALVIPEIKAWVRWRAEALAAAQAQEVVGDDIVFEN